MTFWPSTSYIDCPTDKTFHKFHDLIQRLTFTKLRVVSMKHMRLLHASERLPFRHLIPSLLRGLHVIRLWRPVFRTNPNVIILITNFNFTVLQKVSMWYLWGIWHISREQLPFLTTWSVLFLELAYAKIVETRFPELAISFLDFSLWISIGTVSILLIFNLFVCE